jgi:hypothetical protein
MAKFRAGGGGGEAEGSVDFTKAPPLWSVKASLLGLSVQSLTSRLPGPVRDWRGSVNATGNFQTRGLARENLAENLTGQMEWRVRDISFGEFDPLGTLVQRADWGKLEPTRGPATAPLATLHIDIRDRRFLLKPTTLDLSGASLQCDGTYAWTGALNLNVRVDMGHLRRRWLPREDADHPPARSEEVRLSGSIDHLVVNPQEGLARVGRGRQGERHEAEKADSSRQ